MINTVSEATLFSKTIDGFGTIAFKPFSLQNDVTTLHSWVTQPYAKYWGMEGKSVDAVFEAYQEVENIPFHEAIMGFYNEKPAFLIEKYKADKDIIAKHYNAKATDYGMHILVGPAVKPIKNFTWYLFCATLEFFFTDENVERVVVEPDLRNDKIHVLNKKAGFVYHKEIELPEKKAGLAFCDRLSFKNALTAYKNNSQQEKETNNSTKHIQKDVWLKANIHLVTKSISEFTHELLFEPKYECTENNKKYYTIVSDNAKSTYKFSAIQNALDHWVIDASSITKNGDKNAINALVFITEFQQILGILPVFIGTYLEEISSTLSSLAYKFTNQKYSSEALVKGNFQDVEHAMIEGHPCFIANNGRIGFGADEYIKYAPETDNPFAIYWLAGHKSKAAFTAVKGLEYEQLITQELGRNTINTFKKKLQDLQLSIDEYIFIPVHPWQWNNKLTTVFATDIANKHLVFLGEGNDQFSAQQSIRTLYNTSNPDKFYTKTALSILNMGFMRGLSPYYMVSTPPITDWIAELLEKDLFLKQNGFTMLGEVATIGYRNKIYEALGNSSAHNKMLSALWRESPHSKINNESEKLMTMAAFLHKDKEGTPFISELIKASPYNASEWIERYLEAYLAPLLHCFYTYEFVFMPHGENIIMVMENNAPKRVLMKDITEEVIVFNKEMELPEHVDRLFTKTSDKMKLLSIFTDVFDCIFRFISSILDQEGALSETEFWKLVANNIQDYQKANIHLSDKFEKYDLFVEVFDRCCLNRLQLKNTSQMLDLADPIESLELVGVLKNPIAQYKNS